MENARILLLLMILSCGGFLAAQEVSEVFLTSDTSEVHFRQDKIRLEPQFRDNGERLAEIAERFDSLRADSSNQIRGILIVSGASPEGTSRRNRYLSDNRARVVFDYLIENNLADSACIEIESRGIDWKGLTTQIEASDLPYRDEVLEILAMPEWVVDGRRVVDGRKRRLMNLRGGDVWREIYDRYFPDLRRTRVMITYDIKRVDALHRPAIEVSGPQMPEFEMPVVSPPQPLSGSIARIETPRNRRNLYLAVKTNLLHDLLAIPNIGAEVGVWRGLTVGGGYRNIWLRNDDRTRWYRVEGFDAEVKYYVNDENRPFKGHHIGLYGQMLTWDVTIGSRGYLAERWAMGGGVTYGFALPIGKRFNLDFEIGVGVLSGTMHRYIPDDGCRVWQSAERFTTIDITKVGVSLQWLIGRGNHNERKGGRR